MVQDNIYGNDVNRWLHRVHAGQVHLVVLRPTVEVLEQRHEQRRMDSGKVAYRDSYTAALNDGDLATTPADLGLWLDTPGQTPDDTVAEILARSAETLVR